MKFRSTLVCLVLAVFLFGILSGCSQQKPVAAASESQPSTPAESASTSSAPVCSFLSPADIEAVMGKGATTNAYKPETECIINGAAAMNVLTVSVMTYGGEWSNVKQGFKKTDSSSKDITGLGEDAFTFMGGVVAKKGGKFVSVGGALTDAPMKQLDGAKYLAEKVIAKL
ncbi:MAG TPA: hypothetical protein VD837_05280 [Terriglobales bacterium]|nr:hypothetical protein [Terriglobales bacterium]